MTKRKSDKPHAMWDCSCADCHAWSREMINRQQEAIRRKNAVIRELLNMVDERDYYNDEIKGRAEAEAKEE